MKLKATKTTRKGPKHTTRTITLTVDGEVQDTRKSKTRDYAYVVVVDQVKRVRHEDAERGVYWTAEATGRKAILSAHSRFDLAMAKATERYHESHTEKAGQRIWPEADIVPVEDADGVLVEEEPVHQANKAERVADGKHTDDVWGVERVDGKWYVMKSGERFSGSPERSGKAAREYARHLAATYR